MTSNNYMEQGVSLIELLIVVAIIGILASVALPSYSQFLINERRSDAHHLLLVNEARLSRCFTLAGSYNSGCELMQTSKAGYYQLNTNLTATTWSASATPIPGEPQSGDGGCQSITLDNIGIKSATGGDAANCWH